VLVVVTGHGDEVAVRADLLIETAVVLLLANFAVVVERIVVAGPRRRNEGARAEAGDVAGVDHAERTDVGAVAGAFGENVAVARRRDDAERFAGNPRAQVDRAAGRGRGRAVDVGHAEVDVDLLENLG